MTLSLDTRLLLATALAVVFAVTTAVGLMLVLPAAWLAFTLSLLVGLVVSVVLVAAVSRHLQRGLDAVNQGLVNIQDNDFSMTLAPSPLRELNAILQSYNALVGSLRKERQSIFQRELLLDTVIENSSMSVLITDQNQRIIYSNRVAEQLLHQGEGVTGLAIQEVLAPCHLLLKAVEAEQSGIFRLNDQSKALHHLTCGRFTLNGQRHNLILLKEMTREMNRQEAAAWKRVIRVISHELNNSLAPISSLAHSGQLLLNKQQYEELPEVFDILAERAEHLKKFVDRYAEIAKLPRPRITSIDWQKFHQTLTRGYPFTLLGSLPDRPGHFDGDQMHQVLMNLIKNAAESGSPPEQITLTIRQERNATLIEVADRGMGMSNDVLANALLPFYSTKPTGSGVGLPLCREILEAHEGHLSLANRKSGGLRVTLSLPVRERPTAVI